MVYVSGPVPVAVAVIVPLLPPQESSSVGIAETITGRGLTIMTYEEGVPTQPLIDGVTVMEAEMGAAPALTAVKLGTFPLPLAAKPIAVLVFVHVKVAPAGVPTKLVAETRAPEHTEKFAGTATTALGLTVIV